MARHNVMILAAGAGRLVNPNSALDIVNKVLEKAEEPPVKVSKLG